MAKSEYYLENHTTNNGQGFVLIRSADNQRLSWQTLPRGSGLESMPVAGVSYHFSSLQDASFSPGTALLLLPDPDNEHDSHAIAVWNMDKTKHIGYIPKENTKRLSKMLNGDTKYHCISIWENIENGNRIGLRILIVREGIRVLGMKDL